MNSGNYLLGGQDQGREADVTLMDRLDAVSTVRCDSPMFSLCYGGSPYGQYYACTVNMMHAFEHGVVVYVLKAFVEPISGPRCKLIDRLVRYMFANHRCSEKDNYPRTNFSKGVTHLKLMKCYEWPGFLLVLLILAQSYKGSLLLKNRMDDNDANFARKNERQYVQEKKKHSRTQLLLKNGHRAGGFAMREAGTDSDQGDTDVDDLSKTNDSSSVSNFDEEQESTQRCTTPDFVTLMTQLLTFHAYYKQDSFWKKNDPTDPSSQTEEIGERELDAAMQTMLRQLKMTLARHTGYGWNIQKVHEVFLHLVRQIRESGRPSNSDCQVGERGLI